VSKVSPLRLSRPPRRWWLTAGLGFAMLLALGLPLLVAIAWSVVDPKNGWFAPDILPPSASAHYWLDLGLDPGVRRSIVLTLIIAICVTVLSGILALPTAYALAKIPFPGKRAVELFILAPLIVPGIVIGLGLGVLFLRLNMAITIPGVILAQTVGTLPLMIRVLSSVIESIPDDLLHAARSLGARPWQVAVYVLVPLAWPGFLAGGLLSFIGSLEDFEKTFIVGVPFVETLTLKLFSFVGGRVVRFPSAAVITLILLLPSVVIFFLAERFNREGVLAAGMGKL
jgi:ABC-type spermidine/putrescine transport system permease subunit II